MVTKEYTFKRAFENKRAAVKEREVKRRMLLNSLYASNPRLAQIDLELKKTGAQMLIWDKAKILELKEQSQKLVKEKQAILEKAGIPKDMPDCTLCGDTGYINGKICECIKHEAAKIMAEELSKEMPLKDCRFDNFDLNYYPDKTDGDGLNPKKRMTAVLKLCREYVMGFNGNSESLLFMGGVGLGKTHLTMSIVSGVIEKGFMPIYGSAENLFAIVETEKFSGEGRGNYDAMLNCDLLVIDDLGAEMTTSFTKSVLYNLVNTRILKNIPTIINTNLSMKQIEEKYSARISSRLMSNYNVKKFLGGDIRQKKLLGN